MGDSVGWVAEESGTSLLILKYLKVINFFVSLGEGHWMSILLFLFTGS